MGTASKSSTTTSKVRHPLFLLLTHANAVHHQVVEGFVVDEALDRPIRSTSDQPLRWGSKTTRNTTKGCARSGGPSASTFTRVERGMRAVEADYQTRGATGNLGVPWDPRRATCLQQVACLVFQTEQVRSDVAAVKGRMRAWIQWPAHR